LPAVGAVQIAIAGIHNMNIGDLVKIKTISSTRRIGFITKMNTNDLDRDLPQCYVMFPKTGTGDWYRLSRVEVISEAI